MQEEKLHIWTKTIVKVLRGRRKKKMYKLVVWNKQYPSILDNFILYLPEKQNKCEQNADDNILLPKRWVNAAHEPDAHQAQSKSKHTKYEKRKEIKRKI